VRRHFDERRAGDVVVAVKQLRRRVEPVGPNHGARFLVDTDLAEAVRVSKRGTERAPQQECAVDIARQLVGVQSHKLADEPQGSRRERAVEDAQCSELDLGDVLAVFGDDGESE
jgi:hypothetical protein